MCILDVFFWLLLMFFHQSKTTTYYGSKIVKKCFSCLNILTHLGSALLTLLHVYSSVSDVSEWKQYKLTFLPLQSKQCHTIRP